MKLKEQIEHAIKQANGRRRVRTLNYADILDAITEAFKSVDWFGSEDSANVYANAYGYASSATKCAVLREFGHPRTVLIAIYIGDGRGGKPQYHHARSDDAIVATESEALELITETIEGEKR